MYVRMFYRPFAVGGVSIARRHLGVQVEVNAVMVNFCACVGCSNRWPRNKDKSFYRLPTVITHQGEQTRALLNEDSVYGWQPSRVKI